jgi:hypothetical protein
MSIPEALEELKIRYSSVYPFAFHHLRKTWSHVGELVAGGVILSDETQRKTEFMSHQQIVDLDHRLRMAWLVEIERRTRIIAADDAHRLELGLPRLTREQIARHYQWPELEEPPNEDFDVRTCR